MAEDRIRNNGAFWRDGPIADLEISRHAINMMEAEWAELPHWLCRLSQIG
jgi:hypothetical protein